MKMIKKNLFFILMILFATGMLINDKTDIFKDERYKEKSAYINYSLTDIEGMKKEIYANTSKMGCQIFDLKIFEREDGTVFTRYKLSKVNYDCKEKVKEETSEILRSYLR